MELLLSMVNQELNASQDSGQWKKPEFDKSKAFVIIDNKAIDYVQQIPFNLIRKVDDT